MVFERPGLVRVLHPFGHRAHVQGVGHADDHPDDGAQVIAGREFAHEAAVDLERVEGEAAQVGERGVPRAEIVQRDAHARLAQRAQDRHGCAGLVHEDGFGDLQLQAAGGQPGRAQRRLGHAVQVLRHDLHGRDIDRNRERFGPGGRVAAGLGQHPLAHGLDQSGVLGHGDELARSHLPQLGMVPAQQGLEAGDPPRIQVDDGLVGQVELATVERFLELALNGQAPPASRGHLRFEKPDLAAAGRLGRIKGEIGVVEQGVDVRAVARGQRHADAGAHGDACIAHLAGRLQAVEDPVRELLGLVDGGDIAQDDGELVAPQTRDGVRSARARQQAAPDLAQQLVAGTVPQGVVDGLEMVQVQAQHRAGARLDDLGRELGGQRRAEVEAVGQARERIDAGQAVELAVGLLGEGDVGGHAAPAAARAVGFMQGLGRERPPAWRAGLARGDHEVAEWQAGLEMAPQQARRVPGAVLGNEQRPQQFDDRDAPQLFGRHAKQGREARRGTAQAPLGIDLPQDVAGIFLEVAQQQPDHLALVGRLRLGREARAEHARGGPHAGNDDGRIGHQQHADRPGERIVGGEQRTADAGAQDQHIRRGRGRRGRQGETAGAHHAGLDGGDQHAMRAIGPRKEHHGHQRPERREHGGVHRRAAQGAYRYGGRRLAVAPVPPHAQAPCHHVGDRQGPRDQEHMAGVSPERDGDQHGVEHIGQHGERRKAQHRLDLARAECSGRGLVGAVGLEIPRGPAAQRAGAQAHCEAVGNCLHRRPMRAAGHVACLVRSVARGMGMFGNRAVDIQ